MKTRLLVLVCVLSASAATWATAQTAPLNASPTSESRDASLAYFGTSNFVVGRIGRDCLSLVGRPESPQDLVVAWQQRNARYALAADKYMEARLAEAEANGGKAKRDSVMQELNTAVQNGASVIVKRWTNHPDKPEACKKALSLIDSGAFDISPKSPMFGELEAMVSWAEGR